MIHLVAADDSHTPVIAEMLANLFQEVGHTATASEIADMFVEMEEDSLHSTLLAFDDDGDAVGVLTLVESLALYAGGRIGVINELYVVPPYRSEGVGKILLDAAKDLADERGWRRLEVTTPGEQYEKTLHFYEKEGFMPIGPRYKFEL